MEQVDSPKIGILLYYPLIFNKVTKAIQNIVFSTNCAGTMGKQHTFHSYLMRNESSLLPHET